MLTHREILGGLARAWGDKTAIYERDRRMTFDELDRASDALAMGLLGTGLRPGDRVAWLSRNSTEYFVAYFATAKAGVMIAPLNYWLRADELADAIGILEPRGVIAGDADFADRLDDALARTGHTPILRACVAGHPAGWLTWSEVIRTAGSLSDVPQDEFTPHEIIFTSGTTGVPKGAVRSQRKRVLDGFLSACAFRLHAEDHMLHLGPQFHIGGMGMPYQVLCVGGAVSVVQFGPDAVAEAVRHGVTFIAGVPTHFSMLIEADALDGVDVHRVRGLKLAGSSTSSRLYEQVSEHFPSADLCNGWGMTETGPHTLAVRGRELLARPGTVGVPVPGSQVRVVDGDGNDVANGVVGELRLRAETLMDSYWRQPELTAACFDAAGWFRTGDLGRRDDDGYFYLAGRAKDMIITGGENVYPAEVEDIISRLPQVAEAVVIGVPDDLYGERVVGYVRLKAGAAAAPEDALIQAAKQRLATYKAPREIHFVDDFPRNATGKVLRHELLAQYEHGQESNARSRD